jgi:polar amino acid transport system permease protein
LEARLTKKRVYLDYGIISGYYQTKKINAMLSESVEFVGVLGNVYKIKEGSAGEFIFDCMKWIPSLMQGAKITIALTVVTTIVGMILGLFLALGKMSKIPGISQFCKAYIFFFRGTPLLMQLMFIYYSLPMINPNLSIENRFLASAVAFGLNSGAYCAELIRAAIESIDKGQYEAAKALGFSYGQTMKKIIIPQTYKRLVPPFANEFIMILKDASLTSIIALQDLSKVTTAIQSSSSKYTVFIPSMIIYLLITWVFGKVFECLEKKYSVYE